MNRTHRKSDTFDTFDEIWDSEPEDITESVLHLEESNSNYFLSSKSNYFLTFNLETLSTSEEQRLKALR